MIDVMLCILFGYFNSKVNDCCLWMILMVGIWGLKVMIINEWVGFGGDLFLYMFCVKGIGLLVGICIWGGLVGIWDILCFIDGGCMVVFRGGFFDLDVEWVVEGEGVVLDIEVI